MTSDLVRIAKFRQPQEAHLARGLLDAEGIASFVDGENFNALYAQAIGWVGLLVHPRDARRARQVLYEGPDSAGWAVDRAGPEPADGLAAAAAMGNALVCPKCDSASIREEERSLLWGLLSFLVTGAGLLAPRRLWLCRACGHKWRR